MQNEHWQIHSEHKLQDEIDILQLPQFKREDRGKFYGLFLCLTKEHTVSRLKVRLFMQSPVAMNSLCWGGGGIP